MHSRSSQKHKYLCFKGSEGGIEVDIYAPGANIYCIMPENTFVYSEGSSLSAVFVTGTIAFFLNVDEVCS